MPQSNAPTREQVLAFLNGAGEIDGCGFGDRHPTLPGAFWWRRHLAALSQPSPAVPAPTFDYTDGTLSLEREVLDAIRVYAKSRPESGDDDEESWESWFEAAFDLAMSRVSDVFREMALRQATAPQPTEQPQPATRAGAGDRSTQILHDVRSYGYACKDGDREASAAWIRSIEKKLAATTEPAYMQPWTADEKAKLHAVLEEVLFKPNREAAEQAATTTQPSDAPQQQQGERWQKLNEFDALLEDYWNSAYAEAKEGRKHDTEDGRAQKALQRIRAMYLRAFGPPKSATQQPQPAEQGEDAEDAARLDEAIVLLTAEPSQPATQAGMTKRWPFVLSPGVVSGLLYEAMRQFDGDMTAAVRNVFIEQQLALAPTTEQPQDTAPAGAPQPKEFQNAMQQALDDAAERFKPFLDILRQQSAKGDA